MLLPETLRLHDKAAFEFHYVYFLPWKNQMVRDIEACGGKVVCMAARNNIELMLRFWSLSKYVRENQIDIIHAHLPWAGVIARLVGKMVGVKVVYTEHNKLERYHFLTRWMNLLTIDLSDKVIAVSADVENSLRRFKKRTRVPVEIILNGVNTDRFDIAGRDRKLDKRRLGLSENRLLVGTVAVFRYQKRLDVWMDIASRLLETNPDVDFVIVGDGPLKEQLISKRKLLGLEDRLHFAGLQTDVRPYLSAFDVYMMTSLFEGLPIALLEAMASECPVVTTDAGGIKEVVRNGIDGLMCSVDRPFDLVELTNRLLGDVGLRAEFGIKARSRIVDEFSMKRMVHSLETCYFSIVG